MTYHTIKRSSVYLLIAVDSQNSSVTVTVVQVGWFCLGNVTKCSSVEEETP